MRKERLFLDFAKGPNAIVILVICSAAIQQSKFSLYSALLKSRFDRALGLPRSCKELAVIEHCQSKFDYSKELLNTI